jgi:hypothetical protein
MIDADTVKEVAGMAKSGFLAAFGGMVGYAADVVHRGAPFSWLAWAVFVATAFFVGQVLDSWLPLNLPGRGGVLMVSGTAAYPVLTAMQQRVIRMVDAIKGSP